jgi:tetrahydromethanopterin S-methyltransferase subunit G
VNPAVANVLNLPFVQVALPILIGFVTIGWWQNKRLDEMGRRFDDRLDEMSKRFDGRSGEMSKRFDDRFVEMTRRFDDRFVEMTRRFDNIDKRLERIELKIENHGDRITRLEERTSLVR